MQPAADLEHLISSSGSLTRHIAWACSCSWMWCIHTLAKTLKMVWINSMAQTHASSTMDREVNIVCGIAAYSITPNMKCFDFCSPICAGGTMNTVLMVNILLIFHFFVFYKKIKCFSFEFQFFSFKFQFFSFKFPFFSFKFQLFSLNFAKKNSRENVSF